MVILQTISKIFATTQWINTEADEKNKAIIDVFLYLYDKTHL